MSMAAVQWEPERPAADPRKAHVIQGEYLISDDPDLVMTTILGSCVAACVRDPQPSFESARCN